MHPHTLRRRQNLAVAAKKRMGRLFSTLRGFKRNKTVPKHHRLENTVSEDISDTDTDNSTNDSAAEFELRLFRIIKLLVSTDSHQHRLGFRRLQHYQQHKSQLHQLDHRNSNVNNVNNVNTNSTNNWEHLVSRMIVYGEGPLAGKLRRALSTFLKGDVQELEGRDDLEETRTNSMDSEDDVYAQFVECSSSTPTSFTPTTNATGRGALHLSSVQMIVNALEHVVVVAAADHSKVDEACTLDLEGSFWQSVVAGLVETIEAGDTSHLGLISQSLKVLRHLHTLEPTVVTPLLRHILFPYLVHLADEGRRNRNPLLESEASLLLTCANTRL